MSFGLAIYLERVKALYVDNIEGLDQMFRNSKTAVLKMIKEGFADGELDIRDSEIKSKLLSSTEKCLIFHDTSF